MIVIIFAGLVSAQGENGEETIPVSVNAEMVMPDETKTMAAPVEVVPALSPDAAPVEEPPAAEEPASQVELTGDELEYLRAENKVVATGNVEVIKDGVTLLCDKLIFDRNTQIAHATGNVVLIRNGQRLQGDTMDFNFGAMTGEFQMARIYAKPFYGIGDKIIRVGENHMRMENAYLTTSDWDKPEFRFGAKKVDIYPGDKAVARGVRVLAGKVPILYLPRFTQDLRDKKPVFTYTPGYDGDWGAFLLTSARYHLHDNFKGQLHLDYRQRKDLAWGIDGEYNTVYMGQGLFRTYYARERNTTAKHFFDEQDGPTLERERFKAEWRHRWTIDNKTNAILQYFRASDDQFLKDYFEREADLDENPSTYFLMTRVFPTGTLGFRTEARVNRYEGKVERLPEITYDVATKEIFSTGLYLQSQTSYSNLVRKSASPSEVRPHTMRINTENELSYPFKASIFELRPWVGGQQTFYTRTKLPEHYDSIRAQFQTGADVSTKFYRIFDVAFDKWGMKINRMRHVITPSVDYQYFHDPTNPNENFDQFDEVDSLIRSHQIIFSLENKLQTKRNNSSVDLTRLVVSTPFNLKEDPGKGGFSIINADWEVKPVDYLTFYMDSSYSTRRERLETINFDIYINDLSDRWFATVGKRYSRAVDDQLTSEFGYRINQKWAFRTYNRFDLDSGTLKEQEYTLARDLHSWVMDINYNQTRGDGSEIWLVFTLKDFPDLGIDFGSRFNRRKAGAISSPD